MTRDALYKKGYAVGRSDIVSDSWHFRFYDEVFCISGLVAFRHLKTRSFKGYVIAKVDEVRKACG